MTAFCNLYTSFLLLLATATDRELARIARYLKEENRVLRARRSTPIRVTPQERRRLLRFGRNLGQALRSTVTIVTPSTFLRWMRDEKRQGKRTVDRRGGRPKTADEIRQLILRLARENSWGYSRIMGELKKLRIKPPSRNTVKKILKADGLEPGPMLHVIALAQFSLACAEARLARRKHRRRRLRAEHDRLQHEVVLLREENRIKDAGMARVKPAEAAPLPADGADGDLAIARRPRLVGGADRQGLSRDAADHLGMDGPSGDGRHRAVRQISPSRSTSSRTSCGRLCSG